MDENGYNIFMLCVPKDKETDLPILTDGNVTITRAKVIIMNIQTGNNLFIPLFRRPCLISCETLSVKLPLAPFEFKYNLLINCSSIIDLDHLFIYKLVPEWDPPSWPTIRSFGPKYNKIMFKQRTGDVEMFSAVSISSFDHDSLE